ncbi:MAG: DMT family transporter [Coriobacteriales bacterium]|jgi:drug/metabolite transporter (DMT)-like permease|nr:DMT family transporter [Coriobacteriales bacterium]
MSQTLKNSLLVFIAGVAYGVMVPLVRGAYTAGFTTMDVMAAQYLFAALALALVALLFFRSRITPKALFQLLGLGVVSCGVSFGYYHALDYLPAATAVTLLFQFVWMGVALQAIIERRLPSRPTWIAVALIFVGTFLAAGVFEQHDLGLSAIGLFYGLLSAVFYTAFLFLSGKVATSMPTVNRTLFTTMGSFLISFAFTPLLFVSDAFPRGLAIYALPLALAGILAPILLIQKAAPHLPAGITTIMAASELPSGIIMAAVFLQEAITPAIALGVLIVLAGIVLSQYDELKTLHPRNTTKPLK